MIKGYLVVREEKHIDNKYIVCIKRENAIKIANEMSKYWANEYESEELNTELFGDMIFHSGEEEFFDIVVLPIEIFEGEENG